MFHRPEIRSSISQRERRERERGEREEKTTCLFAGDDGFLSAKESAENRIMHGKYFSFFLCHVLKERQRETKRKGKEDRQINKGERRERRGEERGRERERYGKNPFSLEQNSIDLAYMSRLPFLSSHKENIHLQSTDRQRWQRQ